MDEIKTITGDSLHNTLVELYEYSYVQAKELREKKPEYLVGKWDGYHEAVSTIILNLYGGKELTRLMMDTILSDDKKGGDNK